MASALGGHCQGVASSSCAIVARPGNNDGSARGVNSTLQAVEHVVEAVSHHPLWQRHPVLTTSVIFHCPPPQPFFTFLSTTLLASPRPQVSTEEQKAIISGFDDPSGLQAGGVRANGKKFFTLGVTPKTIYGKQGVSSSLSPSPLPLFHEPYTDPVSVHNRDAGGHDWGCDRAMVWWPSRRTRRCWYAST